MIKRFTSNYNKSPLSNVSKISKIITDEMQELKDLFIKIELYNDVDNAKGKGLDDLGANIRQYRGEVSDELYRVLIKSKIARNNANGTLNNILDVLSLSLNADKNTIKLSEGTNPNYYSINITEVPIAVLNEIGMSVTQLGRLIKTMTGAGITLESVAFSGTFEYVNELVNDINLGYGDVDMTNGGTLGDVYQSANDNNLPL